MGPGTKFQPIIADDVASSGTAKRLILLSGKHYYTLAEALKERGGDEGLGLVRVEELSPFPTEALTELLSKQAAGTTVTWAQEEPANQGAWNHVRPRIDAILTKLGGGADGEAAPKTVSYAGRAAAPTTATGVGAWHKAQAAEIVRAALDPK